MMWIHFHKMGIILQPSTLVINTKFSLNGLELGLEIKNEATRMILLVDW